MSTETIEAPAMEPAVAEPIATEDEAYLEWLEEGSAVPCDIYFYSSRCPDAAVCVLHGRCRACNEMVQFWICEPHLAEVRAGQSVWHVPCLSIDARIDISGIQA